MAHLAYMIREDWADHGTGMARNSARIRDWLGGDKFALLVFCASKYLTERGADREMANYIGAEDQRVGPLSFRDLNRIGDEVQPQITAVALHPCTGDDLDALRRAVDNGALGRLFVAVWSPSELVRIWLDAHGALNLHSGSACAPPNAVMVEAAMMMVEEEYNGLSSGYGKDVVVGLMREFRHAGYPSDETSWARAFIAAGGTFEGLESVRRFAKEIEQGRKHRVETRHHRGTARILEQRSEQESI